MRQGSLQNLETGTLLEGGHCGVRSCSISTFVAEGVWPAIFNVDGYCVTYECGVAGFGTMFCSGSGCRDMAGLGFEARYGLIEAAAETVGSLVDESIGSLAPND